MPELSSPDDHGDIDQNRGRSRFLSSLPYLLILILTLVGVAYTSVNKKPLILYWEILAVLTGVLCILGGWRHAPSRHDRVRLVWTQVLHWAAFLATMNLLLVTDVQQMLNADATGLAVLLRLPLEPLSPASTAYPGKHAPLEW